MACVFIYKNTNTNPQKDTTPCTDQIFFVPLHSQRFLITILCSRYGKFMDIYSGPHGGSFRRHVRSCGYSFVRVLRPFGIACCLLLPYLHRLSDGGEPAS